MPGLTDAEMAQLEAQQPKRGLSDDEMAQLEKQHAGVDQPKSYVKLPQDTGYTPGGQPASVAEADPAGNLRNAKLGVGMAIGGAAGALGEGAGWAARGGLNGGAAGLQKYLGNVMERNPDPTEGVAGNAAIGFGISSAADGLASWLKGAANSSMLRAVGLTGGKSKNIPADLGSRMVDEGIWGTKAGMAKQVSEKYGQAEQQIQDLAEGLEGSVSGKDLSNAVAEKGKQYLNPEDASKIISGREGGVDAVSQVSDAIKRGAAGYQEATPEVTSVRNMVDSDGDLIPVSSETTPGTPGFAGSYGGKGLLALKRAGDSEAFNQSGLMGNTYKADAYRAQADAARQSLSELSSGAMPEALKREQTLLYANKGLMQPTPVYKNPVSLTDIGAAMVGGGAHGLPGAGTATLASKAAVSPLVQSLFAKGAQASSNGIGELTDPAVLQSLFGADNSLSK